jgi:hypothetical protein
MVLKYGGVLTHAGRKQVEFASQDDFFCYSLSYVEFFYLVWFFFFSSFCCCVCSEQFCLWTVLFFPS